LQDSRLLTFEHVKLAPDRACGPLWVQEQIAIGKALHDKPTLRLDYNSSTLRHTQGVDATMVASL
jgi:hypothetical protein